MGVGFGFGTSCCIVNCFSRSYCLLEKSGKSDVKIYIEKIPLGVNYLDVRLLFPRRYYYFFRCNEFESLCHGRYNVTGVIVIGRTRGTLAQKGPMPKGVTVEAASVAFFVYYEARIGGETPRRRITARTNKTPKM